LAQATKKRSSARKRSSPAAKRKEAAAKDRAQTRAIASASLSNSVTLGQMKRVFREMGGIICFFAAVIITLALFTFNIDDPGWSHTGTGHDVNNSVGRAGAWFSDVAFYLFGFMAYLIPILLVALGWKLFSDHRRKNPRNYQPFAFVRVIGIALMLISASGLADLHFGVPSGSLPSGTFGGGILGTEVAWRLVAFLDALGTTLLLLALFFCSLTMVFGTSWLQLIESMGGWVMKFIDHAKLSLAKLMGKFEERSKVRKADRVRRQRIKTTPVATVGDALLDDGSAVIPRTGLGAALEAARNRAKAAARIAVKSIGDPGPDSAKASRSKLRSNTSDIDSRLDGALRAREAYEGNTAQSLVKRSLVGGASEPGLADKSNDRPNCFWMCLIQSCRQFHCSMPRSRSDLVFQMKNSKDCHDCLKKN